MNEDSILADHCLIIRSTEIAVKLQNKQTSNFHHKNNTLAYITVTLLQGFL